LFNAYALKANLLINRRKQPSLNNLLNGCCALFGNLCSEIEFKLLSTFHKKICITELVCCFEDKKNLNKTYIFAPL